MRYSKPVFYSHRRRAAPRPPPVFLGDWPGASTSPEPLPVEFLAGLSELVPQAVLEVGAGPQVLYHPVEHAALVSRIQGPYELRGGEVEPVPLLGPPAWTRTRGQIEFKSRFSFNPAILVERDSSRLPSPSTASQQ